MNVIEYVTEEVKRQGHDVRKLDGIERVSGLQSRFLARGRKGRRMANNKKLTNKEVIAKAIHTNGECGYDGGTWEQIKQSGYECGCFGLAQRILSALRGQKRLKV